MGAKQDRMVSLKFDDAVFDLNLPDSPHCEALDYALDIELPTIVFTGKFDFNTRKSILNKNVLDTSAYTYVIEGDSAGGAIRRPIFTLQGGFRTDSRSACSCDPHRPATAP